MRGRTALLAGWALACSVAAHAADESLAPSAAVSCLTPLPEQRTKVVYPPDLLLRKDEGTVSVELTFTAADRPPSIKVLDDNPPYDALAAVVREHVETFRVPCMKAGDPPVKLRQDYVFIANDGRKVMSSDPRDMADDARKERWSCLKHVQGETRPAYTTSMRRDDIEGNVYVRLRFTGPDVPPEITVLASSHSKLAHSMREYAEGLRLPCVTAEPVEWRVMYHYRLDGGRRTVLKDLTLMNLLRASKPPLPPAYFDFNTMGCPFDVRLSYFQPHSRNGVQQIENVHAARQPFLDWLAGLTLKLSERENTAVLGDTLTVSVPCGKLDL